LDLIENFSKFNELKSHTQTVRLFAIEKKNSKTSPYSVYTLDIEDAVREYFISILQDKIDELKSNHDQEVVLRDYFSLDKGICDLIQISTDRIENFKFLDNLFKQHTNLEKFDMEKEVWAFAIEIILSGDRIIVFKKFNQSKRIASGNGFKFRGKLSKLEDEILIFDKYFECFYVESLKHIFLISERGFEIIFSYHEYLKETSKPIFSVIQNYSMLQISKEILDTETLPKSLLKRLVKLNEKGVLDELISNNNISFFEDHKEMLTKRNEQLRFEIYENKLIVSSSVGLNDLLKLCERQYVTPIVNPNDGKPIEIYRAHNKERI
jgi:hypothetical protein